MPDAGKKKPGDQITFHTPYKKNCSGLLRGVNESSAQLVTIEPIAAGSDLALLLTHSLAGKAVRFSVAAKINDVDHEAAKPLRVYRVTFSPNNPPEAKTFLYEYINATSPTSVPPSPPRPPREIPIPDSAPVEPKATKPAPSQPKKKRATLDEIMQEAEEASDTKPKSTAQQAVGWVVPGVVVLVLLGAIYLFQAFRFSSVTSEVSNVVAGQNASYEDSEVRVVVAETWVTGSRPEQKIVQLKQIPLIMTEHKVNTVRIVDRNGVSLALVMLPSGSHPDKAVIRLIGRGKTP